MASCEKCWSDSYMRMSENPMMGQTEHYHELLKERKDNPCTLEEQAGTDAFICNSCNKKTVHQHTKRCLNCGTHK